ncbi:SAM-dependent methyltransferase [Paenibacillus tritici]|uniref:SAM-dependent methyltransferase n=1 Tax=Paenibacillus tritici TaxID=1873425 RepID=A0ABX2DXD6_9BACL|nr:SAM-dependent methyltransferase [Paenibacillus tritici]NQX48194.1 SAM-dependent methyltransferase [Paenibacillus tritici]
MQTFNKAVAEQILRNEVDTRTLLSEYPEYKDEVLLEINAISSRGRSNLIQHSLRKYTSSATIAKNKIVKSGFNQTTINTFLPHIIKARFAIYLIEQLQFAVSSETSAGPVRFNLWDGFILQRLLFREKLVRKPVSLILFRVFWKLIINPKILMPLVNKQGIYCFYSKPLIKQLSALIGDRECLEIAAGDGTLTGFLNDNGTPCTATDDYSWAHYISYPAHVVRADAKTALNRYAPKVVICSWPVPGNPYEKHVFHSGSVEMYIVIGTRDPAITGDFDSYYNAKDFDMELNEELSRLILPPSEDNAVYIFTRK